MRTDTAVVVWVATVGVHPNRAEATAVRGARALGRVGLAARRVLLASCSLRSSSTFSGAHAMIERLLAWCAIGIPPSNGSRKDTVPNVSSGR